MRDNVSTVQRVWCAPMRGKLCGAISETLPARQGGGCARAPRRMLARFGRGKHWFINVMLRSFFQRTFLAVPPPSQIP